MYKLLLQNDYEYTHEYAYHIDAQIMALLPRACVGSAMLNVLMFSLRYANHAMCCLLSEHEEGAQR